MKKAMYVMGYFSACLTTSGLLFTFLHLRGGAVLLGTAVLIFNLGVLPLWLVLRYRNDVQVAGQ